MTTATSKADLQERIEFRINDDRSGDVELYPPDEILGAINAAIPRATPLGEPYVVELTKAQLDGQSTPDVEFLEVRAVYVYDTARPGRRTRLDRELWQPTRFARTPIRLSNDLGPTEAVRVEGIRAFDATHDPVLVDAEFVVLQAMAILIERELQRGGQSQRRAEREQATSLQLQADARKAELVPHLYPDPPDKKKKK